MKVLEYLEFAADLKGIPEEKKEAEIRKVMGMTKLMEVSERLINNLSKGKVAGVIYTDICHF